MNRLTEEKRYWNKAAEDPKVDEKYISDLTEGWDEALGTLKPKVLEIGCGVGRLMKRDYYGIDISSKMLEIAKKRKPECHFKLCDGKSIPFPDNTFRSVYCVLVFQHIPFEEVKEYITEAHRVLKKKGIFRFQFIEGKEEGPFCQNHSLDRIVNAVSEKFNVYVGEIVQGVIHPKWTWMTAHKE
jgi:ubiquinone/menaquinone biosynthesis C-methylase UbiE